MNVRRRLLEILLAGGALATSACSTLPGEPQIPLCNANPDPCCSMPESQTCADYTACINSHGFFNGDTCMLPDASPADAAPPDAR